MVELDTLIGGFMRENKLSYIICNKKHKVSGECDMHFQPHIYVVTSDTSILLALQSFIYRRGLKCTFSKISQDAYDSFNKPRTSIHNTCFDNPYWGR